MAAKKTTANEAGEDLQRDVATKLAPALVPYFVVRQPTGELVVDCKGTAKLAHQLAKEIVGYIDEPEPEPSGLVVP